jgi:hypothetical protein
MPLLLAVPVAFTRAGRPGMHMPLPQPVAGGIFDAQQHDSCTLAEAATVRAVTANSLADANSGILGTYLPVLWVVPSEGIRMRGHGDHL